MERQIIRPLDSRFSHPDDPTLDYVSEVCQAIRIGDRIFLRGQVAQTLDGEMVGVGDAGAQAAQAMDNISILLEEAGAGLGDIVKMTIYVTDRAHREAVYRTISKRMQGVRYCSTGVTVAGLALPEYVVEIDAEALVTS